MAAELTKPEIEMRSAACAALNSAISPTGVDSA